MFSHTHEWGMEGPAAQTDERTRKWLVRCRLCYAIATAVETDGRDVEYQIERDGDGKTMRLYDP